MNANLYNVAMLVKQAAANADYIEALDPENLAQPVGRVQKLKNMGANAANNIANAKNVARRNISGAYDAAGQAITDASNATQRGYYTQVKPALGEVADKAKGLPKGVRYGVPAALGTAALAAGGAYAYNEINDAKTAAEIMYQEAIKEASEKVAFAEQLYKEACEVEKTAADNGPGLQMPYVDQYRTPAGAAGYGALGGGAAGVMINQMAGGSTAGTAMLGAAGAAAGAAVGAGVAAGAGALTAFINQHRQARAEQQAMQNQQQ